MRDQTRRLANRQAGTIMENLKMSDAPPVIEPPKAGSGSDAASAGGFRVSGGVKFLAYLLSLCLGAFLADGLVSLLDDTTGVILHVHALLPVRMLAGFLAVLLAIVVYGLLAFSRAIPKRCFVPLALFYLVTELAGFPCYFIYNDHLPQISWFMSLAQTVLGLWLLRRVRGRWRLGWPLVPPESLGIRSGFGWRNLAGFSLANLFVLIPAVLLYLFLCTAGLISHFTEGFMTLHPGGFQMQVRKYESDSGKTIQLFPMAHVADAEFYRQVEQSFPTNAVVLMEGVSDEKHLLKQKINYQRMANTLGLTEQHTEFKPGRGKVVLADVDVSQFSTNTLDLLNLVFRFHSGQADLATLEKVMTYSAGPDFQTQLLNDLLWKRNAHLLGQIHKQLAKSDHIVVPWGVAHMPGIAREIQRSGFYPVETNNYMVIRFGGAKKLTVAPALESTAEAEHAVKK